MIKGDRNLAALWDQATEYDIQEGLKAYPRYHSTIADLAKFYGFGKVQAIEAFAALSPNNTYHGNLRSLVSVMWGLKRKRPYTVTTYRACANRAESYLTGEASFLDRVTGLKIRAFRHNILYPNTSTEVTVDGHMIAAWEGSNMTMKEAQLFLKNRTRYHTIANGISRLARKQGIPPPAMQATLWITRKRVNHIVMSDQTSLFHHADDLGRAVMGTEDVPPYEGILEWRNELKFNSGC